MLAKQNFSVLFFSFIFNRYFWKKYNLQLAKPYGFANQKFSYFQTYKIMEKGNCWIQTHISYAAKSTESELHIL